MLVTPFVDVTRRTTITQTLHVITWKTWLTDCKRNSVTAVEADKFSKVLTFAQSTMEAVHWPMGDGRVWSHLPHRTNCQNKYQHQKASWQHRITRRKKRWIMQQHMRSPNSTTVTTSADWWQGSEIVWACNLLMVQSKTSSILSILCRYTYYSEVGISKLDRK